MQGSRTNEVMAKPGPSLWDQAYDSLKSENAELMKKFDAVLYQELQKANGPQTSASKKPKLGEINYQISLLTAEERQSHLNRIIDYNLEHVNDRKGAVQERLGQAVEVLLWANDWMQLATQASPQAAVAWTAICVALPLLTQPAGEEKAYRDGFVYVTSRMRYYAALEGLIFSETEKSMSALETDIKSLYRSILEFQIKGVLRHDRNAFKNFARDLIQKDGWDNMQKGIKEIESRINEDSRQIAILRLDLHLETLANEAEESREMLQRYLQLAEQHLLVSQENLEVDKTHLEVSKSQLSVQEQILRRKLSKEEEECIQIFRLEDSKSGHSYEWFKDRTEDRVDGTCGWFLSHENFTAWLDQESGPLLVSADPGCGKSVLAKYLIDHKLPKTAAVCYFFFKDQVQNTLKQALCALIHQLLAAKPLLVDHALLEYSKNGRGLVDTTSSLWSILNQAAQDPKAGQVIFLLDALDECRESDFRPLAQMLRAVWVKQAKGSGKVKWFLTSRPYEQITSEFQELVEEFPRIRIPGEEESESISQEVSHVIKYRVKQLAKRMKLSEPLRDHLETRLLEIPHRTYLWVYLVFDHLQKGFKKTKKGIEHEIATLPENVNEAYEKILCKSSDEKKARKALCIVLVSSRPLTLKEMNIAVNIETSPPTERFEDLDLESDDDFGITLRGWCGLFLSIYSHQVYFLHQTAREFLIQGLTPPHTPLARQTVWANSFSIQQANRLVAETCMIYLRFTELEGWPKNDKSDDDESDDNESGDDEPDDDDGDDDDDNEDPPIAAKFEFVKFAAHHWGRHFKQASIDDRNLLTAAIDLCDGRIVKSQGWLSVYSRETSLDIDDLKHPIHVLSYLGLRNGIELLLEKKSSIDEKNGTGATALHIASQYDFEIAEFLLEKGAGINIQNDRGQTALHQAAWSGQIDIVALLLEQGAKIDVQDNQGQIALHRATSGGQTNTIALLLEKGAKIDVQDNGGQTALHRAVWRGEDDIVALLLEKGAGTNSQDEDGITPLDLAYQEPYHDSMRKLLQEYGAKRREDLALDSLHEFWVSLQGPLPNTHGNTIQDSHSPASRDS